MPLNPLDMLKNLHLGDSQRLSPEEQSAQDASAQAQQAGDPAWMKMGRAAVDGVAGFTKGLTGLGDQGPAGATATNLGQMVAAGLPFLNKGGPIKSLQGMLSPEAAQAASRSAADVFNPAVAQHMENMHLEAKPSFQALDQTGAFGGDRSVGGLHSQFGALGAQDPYFTSAGSEGIFNAGQPMPPQGKDAVQAAVAALLARGGR